MTKKQSTSSEQPPVYDASSEKSTSWNDEKHDPSHNNCTHTTSQTPYLDATLNRFPSIRTNLLALSAALANIASEKECTKCATESAARSIVTTAKEIKTAKKSGEWTKDNKKALKKEVKEVFGGMKGELKGVWRETKVEES